MVDRPILFSAPMVRAILTGSKTMTRRVVKPYRKHPIVNLAQAEPTLGYSGRHNDPDSWGYEFLDDGAPASLSAWPELCPYGQPGDRLWVKETFYAIGDVDGPKGSGQCWLHYRADDSNNLNDPDHQWRGPWTSPLFMRRRYSRITLEVTSVRVERLQAITESDSQAEGCAPSWLDADDNDTVHAQSMPTYRQGFARIWYDINGAGSWAANPWVWVVEFKRVEQAHG